MSLSHLLEQARPAVESLCTTAQAAPLPGFILFFSASTGDERADIYIARGATFADAWHDGATALQRICQQDDKNVIWLRIDAVNKIEALRWDTLKEKLSKTKRNYFRFGLSFDAEFTHAILEQEINANALLYQGTEGVATPNATNLAHYSRYRYGIKLEWPHADDQGV